MYNRAIAYEETIIQSKDTNKFFRYIKKSRIHSSGIAPLLLDSGEFATDRKDKANCLSDHFAKMCTIVDGVLPEIRQTSPLEKFDEVGHLDPVYCNWSVTLAKCVKLKNKVASGPDVPLSYKKLAKSLVGPLSMIFSLIMQFDNLPAILKSALVTHIFDKGA